MNKVLSHLCDKGEFTSIEISINGDLILLPSTALGSVAEDDLSINLYMENDSIFIIPKDNIIKTNCGDNCIEIVEKNGLSIVFNR